MTLAVKNPPAIAEYVRDMGSVPGLRGPPGGGNGNPLQYSCLETPKDRGAWWATVHDVAKISFDPKMKVAVFSSYFEVKDSLASQFLMSDFF